ncbi:hypothetical protein DACRYDRAFT_21867 [Dacryopinax primogenitus]|uniref:Uncharacterized protein n=1 Tax=Dacryopinax primogenitus (strain DJM 731) TaxID=1858805 RepID=M5FW35_DACPD|nr:uncharacterized protein DACRYDRAFT_21867 [Dacryopinax primogenitus]EJU02081.1 hypothetical protein DACRYDRAFT_21867 [Dacryopinax primogenitus]
MTYIQCGLLLLQRPPPPFIPLLWTVNSMYRLARHLRLSNLHHDLRHDLAPIIQFASRRSL